MYYTEDVIQLYKTTVICRIICGSVCELSGCFMRVLCPECGHSFVMNLSFSHTLSPSAKSATQLAMDLVRALAPEQRQELQLQLSIL